MTTSGHLEAARSAAEALIHSVNVFGIREGGGGGGSLKCHQGGGKEAAGRQQGGKGALGGPAYEVLRIMF